MHTRPSGFSPHVGVGDPPPTGDNSPTAVTPLAEPLVGEAPPSSASTSLESSAAGGSTSAPSTGSTAVQGAASVLSILVTEDKKRWLRAVWSLVILNPVLTAYVESIMMPFHQSLVDKHPFPANSTTPCSSNKTTVKVSFTPTGQVAELDPVCTCGVCSGFLAGIVDKHKQSKAPCSIKWKNCKVCRWHGDWMEVAKCFMGGVVKSGSPVDAANNLITITQCKLFHGVPGIMERAQNVIESRNRIMHQAIMELDDITMRDYIDKMIALLQVIPHADACAAVQQLAEVRDTSLIITGEMEQRIHFERQDAIALQTSLDVKDVQTSLEKQRTDIVSLSERIEQKDGVPTRPLQDTKATFDELTVHLCEHYQETTHEFARNFALPVEMVSLKEMYVSLVLKNMKQLKGRGYQLREGSKRNYEEDEIFSQLTDTREGTEHDPKRIFVEGDPGSGKSTSALHLVLLWSESHAEGLIAKHKTDVSRFPLLIFLRARDWNPEMDVYDAIIHQLLGEVWKTRKNELKFCLEQEQERVLYVVDGYDEFSSVPDSMRRMIEREARMLRSSTLLIMSRRGYIKDLVTGFCLVFTLQGLSQEKQIMLIDKHFRSADSYGSQSHCDLKMRISTDASLKSLSQNPLHLSMLCLLALDDEVSFPYSRTGMYSALWNVFIRRAAIRSDVNETEEELGELLTNLGWVTYTMLSRDNYQLGENAILQDEYLVETMSKDQRQLMLKHMRHIAFIRNEITVRRHTKQINQYTCSHKSFAEFLTAKFITSSSITPEKRTQLLQKHIEDKAFEQVLTFSFALAVDMADEDIEVLREIVRVWQQRIPKRRHMEHWSSFRSGLAAQSSIPQSLVRIPRMLESLHDLSHMPFVWLHECGLGEELNEEALELTLKAMMNVGLIYIGVRCEQTGCMDAILYFMSNASPSMGPRLDFVIDCQLSDGFWAKLRTCGCLGTVRLVSGTGAHVSEIVEAIRVGEASSKVKMLTVVQPHGNSSVSLGPTLSKLELLKVDNLQCQRFVKGIASEALEYLDIIFNDTALTEETVEAITNLVVKCRRLKSLSLISLGPNTVSWKRLLQHLAQTGSQLQELRLINQGIHSHRSLLSGVLANEALRTIAMDDSNVDAAILRQLERNITLTEVILRGQGCISATIEDDLIRHLSGMKHLQVLDLAVRSASSLRRLSAGLKHMSMLISLHVRFGVDRGLAILAEGLAGCSSLRKLKLQGKPSKVTLADSESFALCLARLKQLFVLYLYELDMHDPAVLSPISSSAGKCGTLEMMSFRSCGLTNDHIPQLRDMLEANHRLRCLDVVELTDFTRESADQLMQCLARRTKMYRLFVPLANSDWMTSNISLVPRRYHRDTFPWNEPDTQDTRAYETFQQIRQKDMNAYSNCPPILDQEDNNDYFDPDKARWLQRLDRKRQESKCENGNQAESIAYEMPLDLDREKERQSNADDRVQTRQSEEEHPTDLDDNPLVMDTKRRDEGETAHDGTAAVLRQRDVVGRASNGTASMDETEFTNRRSFGQLGPSPKRPKT